MNMKVENKKHNIWKYLVFVFLGIIISSAVFFTSRTQAWLINSETGNGTCYTKCENKVTISENGISDAVEKAFDAVVLVENYKNSKLYSTGTGFVYKVDDKYGYLLTNYHVVSGQTSLKVILSNDESIDATLLGTDSFLDVAVLSIPKEKVIKVVEIANSSEAKLGDTVFTIGTPVGYEYRGTVTRGILSGKDRLVSVKLNNEEIVRKVLQTDAAINPGNSGGPLVNINGEVIGINSLKLVEDEIEGMGFSIPIEDVINHIETLEKGNKIERPYLGISMINVTDKNRMNQLGITVSSNITKGILITSIYENAIAQQVFKVNDVITKINGNEIKNAAYFRYELYKYNIGDKIKVTYIRNNETRTQDILLKGQ